MPIATCTGCGRKTNSATSNYCADTEMDGKTPKEIFVTTQCYVAFVDGKWVEGCVYNKIEPWQKLLYEKLLKNKET